MDPVIQDVRYALRARRRTPLFTLTILVTLAVGIGAVTAIFSFVDALLLRPLPYGEPERLVAVWQDFSATGGPEQEWFTPPDFRDLRDGATSLDIAAMYIGWNPSLTGAGEPERLTGAVVSADYFTMLGAAPVAGRAFTEADAAAGGSVVLLSHALWQRRFGGAREVIGRTLSLNGQPHTVVGVLPASFRPPMLPAEIWRPSSEATFSAGCRESRGCYVLRVLARIAPGRTLEQARSELAAMARRIVEQYPGEKAGMNFRVVPLQEQLAGPVKPALLALIGAVGLLLLIACVNIANLLLARASGREREIALRVAIGAGRGSIVRQLLTESVILALAGGSAGVLLAYWGVDLLRALTPAGTPRIDEVAVDGRILLFALAVSVVAGILFGLAPALHLARSDVARTLREGGPRASGGRNRLRYTLVVAELALALTLLAGAGLLIRSFARLQSVDPGFDPENVLTVALSPPAASYEGAPQYLAFYDALLGRLRGRPGVLAVGASTVIPMSGRNTDTGFLIEGRPLPQDRTEAPVAWYRLITPDYFRAMGMRVVRGRAFDERDRAGAPGVVIINETMARRYWPGEDPIGKRISGEGPDGSWTTVVGVAADVRHNGLDQAPLVEMYLPFQQLQERGLTLVLRTREDPLALVDVVRREVRALDPDLPLGATVTLQELVAQSVALPRLYLSFFTFFAVVALLLAGVGTYGVTAHAVAQRTQEIGIRMALGAQETDVLRMIARQALLLVGVGLAAGLALALLLSRALATLLFELSPTDPLTYALIAAVLAGTALLASWLPARRATRVDPLVALRTE